MSIAPYSESIIATIYHLFPKATPAVQGKVMYITVRTVFADYSVDDESVYGFIHLAIVAQSNYVKVYASLTRRPCLSDEITDWRLICDHDSAWRDDGVGSALKSGYTLVQSLAVTTLKRPATVLSPYVAIDHMEIADIPEHGFKDALRGKLSPEQLSPQ